MTRTDGFFSPAYLEDPLKFGDQERERDGVVEATTPEGLPVWIITRYAEAHRALDDPKLSKDSARLTQAISDQLAKVGIGGRQSTDIFGPSALFSDPPQHTRLRKLLMAAFTTSRVAA